MDAGISWTNLQDEARKESVIMAKITNLRKWKNGEVFNARDYVYERDLIVSLVNEHEDRIAPIENFYFNLDQDLTENYVNKTITEQQTVAGNVNFAGGLQSQGIEVRTGIKTFIQEETPTEAISNDFWIEIEN
jgi:hypothetical protein